MPTVALSPLFIDAQLDSSGNPLSGGKLFTYAAGSSTKLTTYQDSAGTVAHANPIILNSRGEPPAPVWLQTQAYKFVLAPSTDTDPPGSPIRTIDNIRGVNDVAATASSEWTASGATPTYVSAISFTLVGDQTTDFHVGRRIKCTVTAGTVYGTISASAFTALTTVTVQLDSGALDSGISAVALGINSAANTSLPLNDTEIIAPLSPLAPFENLACARASVSTATITADKVVVTNTNGRKAVLSTVSLTLNLAATGANGLDTGAEAASTWYHLWVIWNGTTIAGLFSLSATAPTLPSGYTHKAYVGAMRNNTGSDLIDINQTGRYVSRAASAVMSGGSATAVTVVDLSLGIPPNVRKVLFNTNSTALAATVVVATLWADSGGTIQLSKTGGTSTSDVATAVHSSVLAVLRSASICYYSVSNANCDFDIDVVGWVW